MPISRSAKKALRQSASRRIYNLKKKRAIDGVLKKIRILAGREKINEARAFLPQAYKAFDKAAKTGVIAKNAASLYKSRLTRRLNKISA